MGLSKVSSDFEGLLAMARTIPKQTGVDKTSTQAKTNKNEFNLAENAISPFVNIVTGKGDPVSCGDAIK
jgi:hypothetical protein